MNKEQAIIKAEKVSKKCIECLEHSYNKTIEEKEDCFHVRIWAKKHLQARIISSSILKSVPKDLSYAVSVFELELSEYYPVLNIWVYFD